MGVRSDKFAIKHEKGGRRRFSDSSKYPSKEFGQNPKDPSSWISNYCASMIKSSKLKTH
jgi:hypothetical protein